MTLREIKNSTLKNCSTTETRVIESLKKITNNYVDFKERTFTTEQLKNMIQVEKVEWTVFKRIVSHCMVNKENYSIDHLLLLLTLINKNYPYYDRNYAANFYNILCTSLMNCIKKKTHYLYTTDMLIYTMHILTLLKKIDDEIIAMFNNKCTFFLRNEEYTQTDLVQFLSILAKIEYMKKEDTLICKEKIHGSLVKSICDKLTFHFEKLINASNDYSYSHNLKKQVRQEISQLLKEQRKKGQRGSVSVGKGYTDLEKTNEDSFNSETILSKEIEIINICKNICVSLQHLKYNCRHLMNEISTQINKIVISWKERKVQVDNDKSIQHLYTIMYSFLVLQLDYHMFYKMILNQFPQAISKIPNVATLFFLLGRQNLFPHTAIEYFNSTFLKMIKEKECSFTQVVFLLEAYGQHNYRQKELIEQFLEFTKKKKDNINIKDRVRFIHALFKLDIYNEELINQFINQGSEEELNTLDFKLLTKLFISLCYFSYESIEMYKKIISNLIKFEVLFDNVYLTQLKICELALRTQHVPNVMDKLPQDCIEFLSYIHRNPKAEEYHIKSDLQNDVKNVLLTFDIQLTEEVPLGPYNIDFVQETLSPSYEVKEEEKEANEEYDQETSKVIIEVNGEHHFYRNSKNYTSLSKLKHKLLKDLGYVIVNIPYFQWAQLHTILDKKAYIKKIMSEHTNLQMKHLLSLNHKTDHLENAEIHKVKEQVHKSKEKTKLLHSIQTFRKKKKLSFLKRKLKSVV